MCGCIRLGLGLGAQSWGFEFEQLLAGFCLSRPNVMLRVCCLQWLSVVSLLCQCCYAHPSQ